MSNQYIKALKRVMAVSLKKQRFGCLLCLTMPRIQGDIKRRQAEIIPLGGVDYNSILEIYSHSIAHKQICV